MDGYRLPGLTLSIEGPTSAAQSILAALFQLCPRQAGRGEMTLTSRLVSEDRLADAVPDWVAAGIPSIQKILDPVLIVGPAGQFAAVARTENSVCCASVDETGSAMEFVATTRTVVDAGRPSVPGRPRELKSAQYTGPVALSVQTVLIPILREVFLRRNRVLVHSAAAACPDGTGILFIADGGGGKTTTALTVLRKGARMLGDDLIVLEADRGRVRASGIPEPMNLTENTIRFFDELRAATDSIPGRPDFHKRTVAPQQIYGPDCMIEQCDLHVVYFVRVTPDGPSVRPLGATDTLNRLFQAHRFAHGQKITERSFEQLSGVVAGVRAYELSTGPDPVALGEWLITNCAAHAAR